MANLLYAERLEPITPMFQCMLQRTVALTKKFLVLITFVLTKPTVFTYCW
jgi:hypothetical protein